MRGKACVAFERPTTGNGFRSLSVVGILRFDEDVNWAWERWRSRRRTGRGPSARAPGTRNDEYSPRRRQNRQGPAPPPGRGVGDGVVRDRVGNSTLQDRPPDAATSCKMQDARCNPESCVDSQRGASPFHVSCCAFDKREPALMFMVSEVGELRRIKRRPKNWETLVMRGVVLVPENRPWTVDERDAVANAIDELTTIYPSVHLAEDGWLKRRTLEYCAKRAITLTYDPDPPKFKAMRG